MAIQTSDAEFRSWLDNPLGFWLRPTKEEITAMFMMIETARPDLKPRIVELNDISDVAEYDRRLAALLKSIICKPPIPPRYRIPD